MLFYDDVRHCLHETNTDITHMVVEYKICTGFFNASRGIKVIARLRQ